MPLFSRLLLVLTLLGPSWATALAAEVRLYSSRGVQAADYADQLSELKAGDNLMFSNRREYTFESFLGHGSTTQLVLADRGTRVLRLPLKPGFYDGVEGPMPYTDFLRLYLTGWQRLRNSGIAVVNVNARESDPTEYLVVERLDLRFTLEEFLSGKQDAHPEAARAREALVDFGASTWRLAAIGDFRPDQVGWDGTRWVLFDFTDHVTPYALNPAQTVFGRIWTLPAELRAAIENAIFEKRKAADPGFCESLLKNQVAPEPVLSPSKDPFFSTPRRT